MWSCVFFSEFEANLVSRSREICFVAQFEWISSPRNQLEYITLLWLHCARFCPIINIFMYTSHIFFILFPLYPSLPLASPLLFFLPFISLPLPFPLFPYLFLVEFPLHSSFILSYTLSIPSLSLPLRLFIFCFPHASAVSLHSSPHPSLAASSDIYLPSSFPLHSVFRTLTCVSLMFGFN